MGAQTSVSLFASAAVVSMHWFSGIYWNTIHTLLLDDSKIPSETWEDNYNYLPAYGCPIYFILHKLLRISISECGGYVLVDCNFFFFSIHLHAYWQFNEVVMFIITICCPNNIWIVEDNGINTVLPSDIKILFPEEHLPEFLLEGELIVCILMQEHSQGRFRNCRNIFSPFFF